MKNLINTMGKKIHTLVTENTPHCHKTRQHVQYCFTQKVVFFYISLFSSPHPASRPPDSRKFHFARATKKPCSVFLHIAAQVMVHIRASAGHFFDAPLRYTC